MSNYEALLKFNRKTVSKEMVQYLASTTASIIKIKKTNSMIDIALPAPPLTKFINGLIKHSNVQTPTLMATSVYLAKLRSIIPSNVYGIETTRHRIFLGCLILAAKTLNDSSPLNKHWAEYTDGLLVLREVNTIERELLEYFDWDVTISTDDLITSLSPFLKPIKQEKLHKVQRDRHMLDVPSAQGKVMVNKSSLIHSRSSSNMSIPSLASTSTLSTLESRRSNLSNYSNRIQALPELSEPNCCGKDYSPRASNVDSKHNDKENKRPISTSKPFNFSKVRPVILKTGLDGPMINEDLRPKKSNWSTFFK
ncbi:Pcl2p [Saccharomyces cerevisiae x Saccharomyces kudriavzevii VIN7]|uniref:Pcl2p n=1 Tax=Saccharomyces cerevisiae x Saccharomyces kudriavzevii (strain VIN7) TaxID=1095631 RepID=H0GSA3_SACCK|nr:Pcl2p [Saccharomyces cerevisiae x Saccharomyces kudriavzevii VIN7]